MTVLVPTTLDEALAALADTADALVLAGGTDAMVEVNAGHRRLRTVISVNRVVELRSWTYDPASSAVRIGAGVVHVASTEGARQDCEMTGGHAASWC